MAKSRNGAGEDPVETKPDDSTANGQSDLDPQPISRILLVDDRQADLLALVSILEPLGQKLVLAGSGEDALRHLLDGDFAVILMDVRMPGLDGMKTARLIRQRGRTAHVPIIFLTAAAIDVSDIMKAYEAGAVDLLLKPYAPEALRSKVKVFVDLYLNAQTIRRQAAQLMQRDREAFERRSELRFRSLLDSMLLCVFTLRPNGMVYYWNRTAADYLGKPPGDAPDSSLLEIVYPEDRDRVASSWERALSNRQAFETQFRMRRHSDGANRWHLCRAVPQSEDGNMTAWICTATDIHRDHEAREEAESANRMKDNFLATVSHELRNPLSAILGWVRLVRSGTLDSMKLSRAHEIVERNAKSLASLIDDILDVARINNGKLNLNFGPVDLVQVVESALSAMRPSADAKEITIESHVRADCEVDGDSNRLQQVVSNLLSNAIKFTPKGGKVQVNLRRDESNVELSISDTGRGISREFLPLVFDPFRQADGSTTREHSGLGLGLSISRQLIELHQGTIRALSNGEAKGATFTVRLPPRSPQVGGPDGTAVHEARRNILLTAIKVLLVDDDADYREGMIETLSRRGAEAFAASSAAEALAVIRSWKPHVLVSDIGMPFEDGYSLISKVRALSPEEGGGIPAVAVTGWGTDADSRRVLESGFQAYLAKPVDLERLIGAIYHLGRRQGTA
jgi:PAS domain S-box-containing protein